MFALLKYENQFLGDLNTAEAIKKGNANKVSVSISTLHNIYTYDLHIFPPIVVVVQARIDICRNLLNEQETQVKGLEVANANLNDRYR